MISFYGMRRPPLEGKRPLKVLVMGDSLALEPLVRRSIDRWLRTEIGDVLFVGDIGLGASTGGVVGSQDLGSWMHSGVGGNTIAQVTARVAGVAAALGAPLAPDVIVDISGTNDISALRTLTQIEADKRTLWAAQQAAWPGVPIVTCSPPSWRSGSASGGTWATKKALRDQVAAALSTWARGYGPLVTFCDAYGGMAAGLSHPPQEISSDGVHPGQDEHGYRRAGLRIAVEILALAGVRRQRRRELVPAKRKAQPALSFVTPGTDRVQWAANAVLSPEAQSFALTCWVRPSTVAGSSVTSIVGQGSTFAGGWALCQHGDGITVYLGNGSPIFAGNGGGYSDAILTAGADHHLALVADRAAGKVGLALNGKTVLHAAPASAWTLASDWFYFGKFVVDGFQGLLKEVAFYKGSAGPSIYDLPRFAEVTYADGIFWDGLQALFRCDEGTGAPAEAASVVSAGTVNGAAWGTW